MRILGFLLRQWRVWRVRRDLYDDQPERHPALAGLVMNELLPWKGTTWRVAMIREQPEPAVILVPTGETRASKFHHLKKLRRADQVLTRAEQDVRREMRKRA